MKTTDSAAAMGESAVSASAATIARPRSNGQATTARPRDTAAGTSVRIDAPHHTTPAAPCVPVDVTRQAVDALVASNVTADPYAALRRPLQLTEEQLLTAAYPLMFRSRRMEERLVDLFRRGQVKGTVTISKGAEATAVGAWLPFRPGVDVMSILHRDFGGHVSQCQTLYKIVCQYMANAESPTRGLEGNVHHGDAAKRRFPMISHLGNMLAPVVGGTWQARRNGEDAFGIAAIGDGATSAGDFHESLNIASVHKVPVIFLVENNHYSFSTPTELQYNCERLSDRAVGYGMRGVTIDGLDVWNVYRTITDALSLMARDPQPMIIECMNFRMLGHAVYDKGDYVPQEWRDHMASRDPVPATRQRLMAQDLASDTEITQWEDAIRDEIETAISAAAKVGRPKPTGPKQPTYAPAKVRKVEPFAAKNVKNGAAVNHALAYLLGRDERASLIGLDIGPYGSAFKTCKGLSEKFGADRVLDFPLAESASIGFCLGASQTGGRPIYEFQFGDFSTEACTQIGLNAGTWFFRAHQAAPMLMRLPVGGGLTMGAFHSGEFEGLWSRFPGIKVLYPATAQETFEALVAGFYDENPVLVCEHKLYYWSKQSDIDFDGDLQSVLRARQYRHGDRATVVAVGGISHEVLAAVDRLNADAGDDSSSRGFDVFNPFVLHPLKLDGIAESVRRTGRLLVVQESNPSQGMGDRIVAELTQQCFAALKEAPRLISAVDQPVPFAEEYERLHRPTAESIAAELTTWT
jgi:2-oxoisovalerate dehydrogenase E1 component